MYVSHSSLTLYVEVIGCWAFRYPEKSGYLLSYPMQCWNSKPARLVLYLVLELSRQKVSSEQENVYSLTFVAVTILALHPRPPPPNFISNIYLKTFIHFGQFSWCHIPPIPHVYTTYKSYTFSLILTFRVNFICSVHNPSIFQLKVHSFSLIPSNNLPFQYICIQYLYCLHICICVSVYLFSVKHME